MIVIVKSTLIILKLFGDNRGLRFGCANFGWRIFYFKGDRIKNPRIEEIYNDIKSEKDFIMRGKAKSKLEEIVKKWNQLAEKLPYEEKEEFDRLYDLSTELMDICCLDHFEKGFKIGVKITHNITERLDLILK